MTRKFLYVAILSAFVLMFTSALGQLKAHAVTPKTISPVFPYTVQIPQNGTIKVGSIYADSGNLIISLSSMEFGVTQYSSGADLWNDIHDGYQATGTLELKIVADDGTVVYDKTIDVNGWYSEYTQDIYAYTGDLSFNPTSRLDFYVTNNNIKLSGWGNTYYKTFYLITTHLQRYPYSETPISTTVMEADQISLRTQQYAQQARDAANNTVQYAQQARDAANNTLNTINTITNPALTVVSGSVQDSQGTVLQAARQARDAAQQVNNKLDNLNQTVNNISQSIPPILNGIHGLNGATATSSGALQVVIDSSGATQYSYKIDNGGWSPWMPIQDTVSIPVPKGVHTLTVQVANGPVGKPGPAAKASMQAIGL